MKQGQTAVLAPKKETFYPKVQSEPKLGGEGSGFPPPYCVATGQHNRTVLGIDLGSENIRVTALEEDHVNLVLGYTPSSLAVNNAGLWTLSYPAQTYSKETGQYGNLVQALRTKLGTDWCKDFQGQSLGAEELTRKILQNIIDLSKARSRKVLRDVVFTVPASYTSMERKLLKTAAEDNGLAVIQLINEPTAVALSYCLSRPEEEGNYIIFHMGAGTCAATVYSLTNGIMEIKATSADSTLGGRNFDELIVNYLIARFAEVYGQKLLLDEPTLRELEAKALSIKHQFLMSNEVFYRLFDLAPKGRSGGYHKLPNTDTTVFSESITRQQFDDLIQPVVERAVSHVQKALQSSHLPPNEINKMLICGGATLSATLRSALAEIPGISEVERLEDDTMAACGAAIQASLVCQTMKELVVWDLLTKPISIITADGSIIPLIAANTPLPVTAYAKLEIVDNTINARLVQGDADDSKTYTDIVINNCPPSTNGDNKVELAVRVNQDGIINYGARHIGLEVSLLVSPLQDERRRYQGDLEGLLSSRPNAASGPRAQRLARTLNVPLYCLPQALRALGYTPEQIVSGQAIELALRKIKLERRGKGRSD